MKYLQIHQKTLTKQIKTFFKVNRKFPKTTLENYQIIKLLGKGNFGKVYLGKHILTEKFVALKRIDKDYL